MSIPFNMKREDLLAKLEALLPEAERHDKEAQAQHKLDEKAYLVKFRQACREAVKWSYDEAKKQYFAVNVYDGTRDRYGRRNEVDRPTCPISRVQRLTGCIESVRISTMQRFVISHDGKYRNIHRELTAGIKEAKDMCV